MTFFWLSSRLVITPTFRPRLFSVLSKFSHIFFISFGCHPLEGVTRGVPTATPLLLLLQDNCCRWNVLLFVTVNFDLFCSYAGTLLLRCVKFLFFASEGS